MFGGCLWRKSFDWKNLRAEKFSNLKNQEKELTHGMGRSKLQSPWRVPLGQRPNAFRVPSGQTVRCGLET